MSGDGSMAAWRRQNSESVLVDVRLNDGSLLKGTLLVQREKTLLDIFCGIEPFVEFHCSVGGEMVLSKAAVATVRQSKQLAADQIERRLKMLQKSDAFGVLKLPKTADRTKVDETYLAMSNLYHPDRYAGIDLPPEVAEYLQAMTQRIEAAYSELVQLMNPAAANDIGAAA